MKYCRSSLSMVRRFFTGNRRSIRLVNRIDAHSIISKGTETPAGEQVLMKILLGV